MAPLLRKIPERQGESHAASSNESRQSESGPLAKNTATAQVASPQGVKIMFDLQHALNIRGWLDPEEAQWLYDRACTMQSVIEIGSWCGRSTYCLLSGCKGPVYAVDTFEGSRLEPEWVKYAREHGVYDQFILNVGGFPNLHVMHMRSDIAVAMLPVVDMVFIDGSHAYEDVKADIYMYTDKAAKLLCGHDYTNPNCGVKAAVDEAFQSVQRFDTIWYIEKGV